MHVTKKDWADLLKSLSIVIGHNLLEIHTRDFYAGNGPWRTLDGDTRSKLITTIFTWLNDRKHKVVYAAIDKQKYEQVKTTNSKAQDIGSIWCALALHICLALQKNNHTLDTNKGHTILIFDNKNTEEDKFIIFSSFLTS